MSKSPYIPFNSKIHQRLLEPTQTAWNHAAKQYLIPVTAIEIPKMSSVYPLMLVKDKNTSQFRTVAVMSFKSGSNLYYQTGLWEAGFAPLKIRSYPFTLRISNDNTAQLLIDDDCKALNVPTGEPLFDNEGKEGDILKNIKPLLKELAQYEIATEQFINTLKELDLLCEVVLSLSYSDLNNENIAGYYSIDYQKLTELPTEKISQLFQQNYLHLIYSFINSVNQFQILKQRHNEFSEPGITEIKVTRA